MNIPRWSILVFLAFMIFSHGVVADIRPPNTAETQLISTLTSVKCNGAFTESDSLVWRQSNEALDMNIYYEPNNLIDVGWGNGDWVILNDEPVYVGPGNGNYIVTHPGYEPFSDVQLVEPEPPLAINEVQMTSSTRETTMADHGETAYTKRSAVDTDWKTANMYNVEQEKMVGFRGSETGRITSEESALVDAAGMAMTTLEDSVWKCPFSWLPIECTPPFCNVVEMGSSIDMREVYFTTSIQSRTIADIAVDQEPNIRITLPVVDGPPTELNYRIEAQGVSSPAIGSVSAYINAHAMDGTTWCPSPCGGPGIDLVYKEKTAASGAVQVFQKRMYYKSGIKIDI